MVKTYLLMPHIKIHNANAMGSPYTIGVPSMTAWLGSVHALERNLRMEKELFSVHLIQTGVVFHKSRLHVYRGPGDYVWSIIGTGNPLTKEGKRASFIEEPRIDLTVSLLVEVQGVNGDNADAFLRAVSIRLPLMKIASGDVISTGKPECLYVEEGNDSDTRKVLAKLMPGYALVSRKELLAGSANKDALQTLLSFLSVHYSANKTEEGKVLDWTASRSLPGWLIPLGVGFKGLSPLGHVKNQRDPGKQHRFAENVVTLGEFVMPYRAGEVDSIMWHYSYDPEKSLYLCENGYVKGGHKNG